MHKCGSRVEEKAFGIPTFKITERWGSIYINYRCFVDSIGAILTQKQGTEDRFIAYSSKILSRSQRNYSATKRELFAIVPFAHYFKIYLLGQHFLIITDYRAL